MSIAVSQANLGHQAGHQVLTPAQRLAGVNEETWLQVGKLAEMMNELDRAMAAYESALRQNPYSIPAMNQIATILRAREQFPRAVEYFQSILNLDQNNGETWGSLGHCYLMMDDLQKAYSAYQQALYHLQNPKEPKLWYGIGILYDRYGSLEHAEEAFSQVMRMDSNFDKANEIYFRLGIIYKQQHKYSQSLECFNYIITNPPKPLTEVDIWFQIGHVYEQQKEYGKAKDAYERVLRDNPDHAKVLQQLGWLYHQQSSEFPDQDLAVQFLTRSIESDGADAQSWYLLGRCYMALRKYNKAYEAYQQAVYRDGRNPTFWCSIGVLYYQINQYRDALDAYSRAIRLNPYISEVWYDLGTLYESCNNQVSDALDAYSRAAELDPGNPHIKARLELLRSGQSTGARPTLGGPHPQDVNPNSYQSGGPGQQWSGQQINAGHQQQQQQHHQQHPPPPPQQQQQHQQQQQQQQSQQHVPLPSSAQQQQQSHQQQRGPTTPSQTPFRPAEVQAMRPPQSPDRSKLQNGARGINSSKMDPSPQMPPYQPPQQQQQHNPYVSHHTQGPPIAPINPGPNQAGPPPVPGSNLAPMLGRTSPVSEIKPLASRDDDNAPREQPSTPGQNQQQQQQHHHHHHHHHNHSQQQQQQHPSQHQHGNKSRSLTPVPKESDASSLKRPREWDESNAAPDPKKQELSEPKQSRQDEPQQQQPQQQHPQQQHQRPRHERSRSPQQTSRRDKESDHATNGAGRPSTTENDHEDVSTAADQINGRDADERGLGYDGQQAVREGDERHGRQSSEPQHQQHQQQPQQQHQREQQVSGQTFTPPTAEAAERKVDLDENYDDDEEEEAKSKET